MARRPVFCISEQKKIISKQIEFNWISGLSKAQKMKNADSLLQAVQMQCPSAKPLEISTKSRESLGAKLSAFDLKYQGYYLENIFQSSKIFTNGGAYPDLLHVSPKEAKKDLRLRNSGALKAFCFEGITWELEPKTAFYDFIYLKAVQESLTPEEIQQIRNYTHFTDIEFNPDKSINTQARSVAEIRLMLDLYQEIPELTKEKFIDFYQAYVLD